VLLGVSYASVCAGAAIAIFVGEMRQTPLRAATQVFNGREMALILLKVGILYWRRDHRPVGSARARSSGCVHPIIEADRRGFQFGLWPNHKAIDVAANFSIPI
jgi:hypothetical protein